MTSELKSWNREYYVAGGGEPFLFYVVFGNIDLSAPLSRSKYRSQGAPAGIDVMSFGPEKQPEVPGSFCEGLLWDVLVEEAPDTAAEVIRCEQCLVLRGTPSDDTSLDYLRDTVGLITYLLDQGGCAVYDPQMLRWWPPAEWKSEIFDPADSVPGHHTVILISEEDEPGLRWFHTRGMRKFGRPDISVHNVSAEEEEGIIKMCQRLIDLQARGHVVSEGQVIRMDSLPTGGVIRHAGDFDDPEFNNVHIEVSWPE